MKTKKEKLEYLAKNLDPFLAQGSKHSTEVQKILEELKLLELSPIELTNYILRGINS